MSKSWTSYGYNIARQSHEELDVLTVDNTKVISQCKLYDCVEFISTHTFELIKQKYLILQERKLSSL